MTPGTLLGILAGKNSGVFKDRLPIVYFMNQVLNIYLGTHSNLDLDFEK